ncbi:MAG: PEP/pyruvate-binding domain-containing protein [Candidatus Xenobiia bacterium LiM19]
MEHSDSHPFILSLESISEKDACIVGPKAFGIARLMKLGLPVPGGFCVTTEAYREHLEKCRAESLINELHDGSREAVLGRIREIIIREPLASDFEASLRKHFQRLEAPLAAVRSSAMKEDLSARSFAGLYDTYLGINNVDSCIESLKKCWASLWTDRVFQYRNGDVEHNPSFMAVIVQRLVQAESSGVIFTGGTTEDEGGRIVIEACFGLGEALVSGRVTPDRFIVRRKNLAVIEAHLAEKPLRILALPDGSLKEHNLSLPESGKASIDRITIRKLCGLALKAGSLWRGGQDIEWAIEGGRIYLLQCRPVTARFDGASPIRIFSSANLGEVFPDVVTPLTRSFAIKLMELPFLGNFKKLGIDFGESGIMAVIDGRLYYDITALAAIMEQLPGHQADSISRIMGGHQERLVGRLLGRLRKNGKKLRINLLKFLINYPLLLRRMVSFSARNVDRVIDELNRVSRKAAESVPGSLSGSQLLEILCHITRVMQSNIPEGVAAVSGSLPSFQSLHSICAKWLGDCDGSLANRLMVGSGSIVSADPGIALSELATIIHSNPELEAIVRTEECFASLNTSIRDLQGADRFLACWNDFMERYGHHSIGEFEFYNPRWSETPDYVLSLVKGYVERIELNDTLDDYRKRARECGKLAEECRARLGNPVKRMIFSFFLNRAARGLALRERYKSETIRQIAFMRILYRSLGRDFVSRGILEMADDIFFLESEELEPLNNGSAAFNVKEIIAQRRKEYEKNREHMSYPVIIASGSEMTYLPYDADGAELMTGLGVSAGRARGPARVILQSTADGRILPGEILVIPFADPGWSPYFFASAGIVVDMGGMLSHASIIAREYGIPAVVNVGHATGIIRTGQIVEVDGNSGIVRIIRSEDAS